MMMKELLYFTVMVAVLAFAAGASNSTSEWIDLQSRMTTTMVYPLPNKLNDTPIVVEYHTTLLLHQQQAQQQAQQDQEMNTYRMSLITNKEVPAEHLVILLDYLYTEDPTPLPRGGSLHQSNPEWSAQCSEDLNLMWDATTTATSPTTRLNNTMIDNSRDGRVVSAHGEHRVLGRAQSAGGSDGELFVYHFGVPLEPLLNQQTSNTTFVHLRAQLFFQEFAVNIQKNEEKSEEGFAFFGISSFTTASTQFTSCVYNIIPLRSDEKGHLSYEDDPERSANTTVNEQQKAALGHAAMRSHFSPTETSYPPTSNGSGSGPVDAPGEDAATTWWDVMTRKRWALGIGGAMIVVIVICMVFLTICLVRRKQQNRKDLAQQKALQAEIDGCDQDFLDHEDNNNNNKNQNQNHHHHHHSNANNNRSAQNRGPVIKLRNIQTQRGMMGINTINFDENNNIIPKLQNLKPKSHSELVEEHYNQPLI